jgi:serine/threonine protein kinase
MSSSRKNNNWVDVSKRSSRLSGHKRDHKPVELFRKNPDSTPEVDCDASTSGGSGSFGETQICTGKFSVGVTNFKRLNNQAWSYKRKGYVSVKRIQKQEFKCVVKYLKITKSGGDSTELDNKNLANIKDFEKERKILQSMQGHPNIVNIIPNIKVRNPKMELLQSTNSAQKPVPYYVMEYCTEGDCNTFVGSPAYNQIKANRSEFSKMVRNYISDVYSGIKYIHSKGYIHCDIKPGNIFVTKPQNIQAGRSLADSLVFKIGDFGGLSKVTEEAVVFTRNYAPPERYIPYIKHFQDYYGFALSLFHFITDVNARNKIYSNGNESKYISQLFAVDDWVGGSLNEDTLHIVRDIFTEMNKLEKGVIGIIDTDLPAITNAAKNDGSYFTAINLKNAMDAKLALDTPMYQQFYGVMTKLNNYKFKHISNEITRGNVTQKIIRKPTAGERIRGAVNWFKRLATGKPVVEPITKSQRIQRLARSKKRLLKSGANVVISKGRSGRKQTDSKPKSTRIQRLKRTLKNLFKRR